MWWTIVVIGYVGKYRGRRATFGYNFKNGLLTEILVCLNNSSEKEFKQMHAQLSADFGPLPPAVPTESEYYKLMSKGKLGGLEIEHYLVEFESSGPADMIRFRKMS